MTLEPTSIDLRLEDVIVQKEPARPVYAEHCFVTTSTPVRGEDADNEGAPACRTVPSGRSFFGAVRSEQAVMTSREEQDHLDRPAIGW
jgi:hypothetical protein